MSVKNSIQLVIFAISVASSLCQNFNSEIYTLYQNNGSQRFQFITNFESMYLVSHKHNHQTFGIIDCLLSGFKNISTIAITYQINDDSTNDCKVYSPPFITYKDIMNTSTNTKLFISDDIPIQIYYCKKIWTFYFVFLKNKISTQIHINLKFEFSKNDELLL